MEFNQLESFLSVVKHKSFSKAAKELYLTQPTISNNIQNLEKELSTTLLDRKSKVITLTDQGHVLYKYAVDLINMRDQAKWIIKDENHPIEGTIEIKSSSIPQEYILPYIIRDFTKLYPLVSFSVSNHSSTSILDNIIEGRESFGIVGAKYNSRMLEYIDFYEDELILAVPNTSNYNHFNGVAMDQENLFSQKFIFRKEGSGTRLLIQESLNKSNISLDDLNIVALIDSDKMIKNMIQLELGVSFISKISIKNEVELGLIKALKVEELDLKRNFYFVYNKNRTLSPLVDMFRQFLETWPGIQV